MHDILVNITNRRHQDLLAEKQNNRFKAALIGTKHIPIIGEIKLASPSAGKLGSVENLPQRVRAYCAGGVAAISVITEKHFFDGDIAFVSLIKRTANVPILQKDFVIDDYQIYQAKALGSDAILLIAKLVNTKTLQRFVRVAKSIGIEPVVEIGNSDELAMALRTQTDVIAVNARNLDTFEVNVATACQLLGQIPDRLIRLGFSGIQSVNEVRQYQAAGAQGVLVGTSLMKAADPPAFLEKLKV